MRFSSLILLLFFLSCESDGQVPFNRNVKRVSSSIKPWIVGPNQSFEPRPMFGFMGQSNVDGRIAIASLPAPYQTTYPNVQFYKQLTTLNHCEFLTMNWADESSYKAGNPIAGGFYCLQFYLYPNLIPNKKVYIVHHALGGTSLAVNWKSTATQGALYLETIFKFNAAVAEITNADGVAPSVKFIYWGQGENDARNSTDAGNYQTNLTNLINNFRAATGINAPWIICKLNIDVQNATGTTMPFYATVRTAQENVAAGVTGVANVKIFSTDAIAMDPDHTHYLDAGYQAISDSVKNVATRNHYIP